jgi:hypothetical protein
MTPEATDLSSEMQEQKVWDDCYSIAICRTAICIKIEKCAYL